MIGISNEPVSTITKFVEDQGITFPVLHDVSGIYNKYNIPGSQSPFPRDFIIDENGIIIFAKTEYDPGSMIAIFESIIDNSSTVAVEESTLEPNKFELFQNYPNPFNPTTTIRFNVTTAEEFRLDIINLSGQIVNSLLPEGKIVIGSHTLKWNGKNFNGQDVPSGIYFAQLRNETSVLTKKMILMH